MKRCPLTYAAGSHWSDCIREKCEWWIEQSERCSLAVLVQNTCEHDLRSPILPPGVSFCCKCGMTVEKD